MADVAPLEPDPPGGLEAALAAVHGGMSLRRSAKTHGVSRTTLRRYVYANKMPLLPKLIKRGRPLSLPPAVEAGIASMLKTFALHDLPLQVSDLPAIARRIASKANIKNFSATPVWVQGFRKRHPELRYRKPRRMGSLRFSSLTPAAARAWHDTLCKAYMEVFETTAPSPDRVYNMDESPFNPDASGGRVITVRGLEPTRVTANNREFFTVVTCIGADGWMAPPMLILDGMRINKAWFPPPDDKHTEVHIDVSPTHTMDSEMFGKWLTLFSDAIRHRRVQLPVLLILDSHSSHITFDNIQRALDMQIIMLGLPSNTTSAWQPLDAGVFQPVKTCWRRMLDEYVPCERCA